MDLEKMLERVLMLENLSEKIETQINKLIDDLT